MSPGNAQDSWVQNHLEGYSVLPVGEEPWKLWSKGVHSRNLREIQVSGKPNHPSRTSSPQWAKKPATIPTSETGHVVEGADETRPDQTSWIRGECSAPRCPTPLGHETHHGKQEQRRGLRMSRRLSIHLTKRQVTQTQCTDVSVSLVPTGQDGDLWKLFWRIKGLCYHCIPK